MKRIVIGDIHGRNCWKQIIQQDWDEIIFIGDYFDSFDISGVKQIHNFKEIIELKQNNPQQVKLLIGNHDYHYMPHHQGIKYSGYQGGISESISAILYEHKDLLQMCYKHDEFVYTHAGITNSFMNHAFKDLGGWYLNTIDDDINTLYKYKPHFFNFGVFCDDGYIDSYGNDIEQSPIWVRPKSLMRDNKKTLKKHIIQIVGHTTSNKIDLKGKATGGRYYFIDTLGTSREYLIIHNNIISKNIYL